MTSSSPTLTRSSSANRRREFLILLFLSVALLIVMAVSLAFGRYQIPLSNIINILLQNLPGQELDPGYRKEALVLFAIRMPRVLLGVLVGAALVASGAAYQGLF